MEEKEIKISIEEIINLLSKEMTSEKINSTSSIDNCISWDSLSHASIIASISENFNVEITPSDFLELVSVKRIYEFLNK